MFCSPIKEHGIFTIYFLKSSFTKNNYSLFNYAIYIKPFTQRWLYISIEEMANNHLDALYKLAEENGIERTHWSYDGFDNQVRDFTQPHNFTAKYINAGCCDEENCYGSLNENFKPCQKTLLIGSTWLDLWKSIENYCRQKKWCNHIFIECMEQRGDTLYISCGS
jgi:hypothetical protein